MAIAICDACLDTYRRHPMSEHLVASCLRSQVIATSIEDDLTLVNAGWTFEEDGRLLCPDHTPTAPRPVVPR